jgi:hypothetical protein
VIRLAFLPLLLLAGCEQDTKLKPAPIADDQERSPATQIYIDPKRISVLQSEATKACLCKRSNGGDKCWNNFTREVDKYRQSGEWASACGPGSTSGIDFESAMPKGRGGNMTVLTSFGYGACSADEVAAKKAEYEQKSGMKGC